MQILCLIFALVAVILGFVGLITIIKGFVDKSSKNIWLGTVLVCIFLIIGVCGSFLVVKKTVNAKRNVEKECKIVAKKYVEKMDRATYRACCQQKTAKCDSIMKVEMEKKVTKK